MNQIVTQKIMIQQEDCAENGILKLSALLYQTQEISSIHCEQLGYGWDAMVEKGIFWAVLRHKIYVHSLPAAGQTVILETWPLPTTRVAYPRAVRARDEKGNMLFEVVSLWVLMNIATRTMVLPGKSGVAVEGFFRGDEPEGPATLVPGKQGDTLLWQVTQEDLDQNGHVNNGKYLDHVQPLWGNDAPGEVTVCYLSEVLPGQEVTLQWSRSPEGSLTVDGYRTGTDVHAQKERVFAVRISG